MEMTSYQHITCTVAQGVATIAFARPAQGNASSQRLLRETLDALHQLEVHEDVGAIVLTGSGRRFNSGFDLKEIPIGTSDDRTAIHEHFRITALYWHAVIHMLVRIQKPVLAAVNGTVAGGGLGMILASDMAVAVEGATFVPAWMSIGIGNDTGTSYGLARIIGFRRAMEWLLTNETIGSQRALEWGLVNRVYPAAEFPGAVERIATDLAAGPTHIQAMVKERLHQGWRQSLEECTELEVQNVMRSVGMPHFVACLNAFLDGSRRSDTVVVRVP